MDSPGGSRGASQVTDSSPSETLPSSSSSSQAQSSDCGQVERKAGCPSSPSAPVNTVTDGGTSSSISSEKADTEGPHYDVKVLQEEGKYDEWAPLLRDILPSRGASLLLGQIRFDVTTEDERGSWLLPEELLAHQGESADDEQEERQVFSNTPVSKEEQRAIDDVILHLLEMGSQGEAGDASERTRDALVGVQPAWLEQLILRYLHSCCFDKSKTLELLQSTLAFRTQHLPVVESEVFSDLRNVGACYWHGRDRKMRPLLVISLQRLQQLQREAGAEEKVTRLLIFCLEFFLRYLCVAGVVENWCILCDLDGTSLLSFPLPLLLKLIQLIQGAYRGRLYHFHILHAPRLFHFVARPLLASLPPSTARKVRVYTQLDDWHQERRTQFADHQLEKKYGGTAPDITKNWYPFHFFPGPFEPGAVSSPSGEGEKAVIRWKSERSLHARVHPSVHTGASLHTSLLWRRPIKDQGRESACADEAQTLRYAAWLHHLPELHLLPKAIHWARVALRGDLLNHHHHLLQHLQNRLQEDTPTEAHVFNHSIDSAGDHRARSTSFESEPQKNVPVNEEQDPHNPAVSELLTARIADPPLTPATSLLPPHSPFAGEGSHTSSPEDCKRAFAFKSAVSVDISGFTSPGSFRPAPQKELQESPLPISCAAFEHPVTTGLKCTSSTEEVPARSSAFSSHRKAADEEQPGKVLRLHAAVNKHKASQTTSSNASPAFTCSVAQKMEYCSTGPGEGRRVASLQDLKSVASAEASEHLQLISAPPSRIFSFLQQKKARENSNRDFRKGSASCDSWWPSGGQALSSQLSSPDQQQSRLCALRRLESPLQQQQQLLLPHADVAASCLADGGSRFFGIAGRPTEAHVRAYWAVKWPLPPLSAAAADTLRNHGGSAAAASSPVAALRSLDAGDAAGGTRGGGSVTHEVDQCSLRDAESTGSDAWQPRTMPRVGSGNRGQVREPKLTKHAVLGRRLGSQLSIHHGTWTCADEDISSAQEKIATSLTASNSAALCIPAREAQRDNQASQLSLSESGIGARRVVAPVAPQGPQRGASCHKGRGGPPGGSFSTLASNPMLQVRPSAESNTSEKGAKGRVAGFLATQQQSFKNACASPSSSGRRVTANQMLPLLFFAGILLPAAAAAVMMGAGAEGSPALHASSLILQPSVCPMPWASGLPSTVRTPGGQVAQTGTRRRSCFFAFVSFLPQCSSSRCGGVEGYARSFALPVVQWQPTVFVSTHASPNAACSPSCPLWQLPFPSTSRGSDVEVEQHLFPHASAAGLIWSLCMRRAVRVAAVKPKSRGSIDKRFKVTATGKLMYRRPGLQHHASTKTAARRTRLRRTASLRPSQITRLLGPLSLRP